MDKLYIRAEFDHLVSLTPAELDRNLDDRIRKRVYADLENKCMRNVGHIRANSVEILNRQQGTYTGSHTTGNVLFKLRVRCMAAQPVKGALVTCRVTGKNNAGILASNYAVPFLMFVPKDAELDNEVDQDQVAIYDTIEVEMLDYKLQAPPTDQYWIICRITQARLTSTVLTRLPKENLLLDMLWRPDYNPEQVDKAREDLTGNWFTSLKTVREKIDTDMKMGYLRKLRLMADPFTDFVLKAGRAAALKRTRFAQAGESASYRVVPLSPGGGAERVVRTIVSLSKNDVYIRNNELYSVQEALSGDGMDRMDDPDPVDVEYGINIWSNHIRKFINAFELLRPDGDYQDQMRGLIPYQVTDKNVSRAYYKLYEMLKMREESLDGRHIFAGGGGAQILCMGEAPGGFINALLDLYGDRGNTITGVSISEDVNRTRVWGRLEDLITKRYPERYTNVHIMTAEDHLPERSNLRLIGDPIENNQQPGDILSLDNQRAIAAHFQGDRQAVFITADGGAPHDIDTESEIHHSRLIFAEILLALRCQQAGGNFVLKLFDITTGLTLNLVTILSHFYERVHLYKPKTSRLASSEKYIVCLYFMPRDDLEAVIPTMEKILEDWNDSWTADGQQLVSLFLNGPKITAAMKEYNEIFMQKQTQFIRSGIEYADRYNTLGEREIEGLMRQTLKDQLQGSCEPFLAR